MKVDFFKHNIGSTEIERVTKVLNSLFLTNADVTKEFEEKLSKYLNIKHCIGLNSCTAALHLSLLALGIQSGDEVITTPLTFVASAHTILHVGAKPVFVDVDPYTGNINPNLIENAITKKTKAIMLVHLYGNLCDMKAIRSIADKYKLKIIEDAAHCIEGIRDGIRVGELGDTACFSFYATKNITSGEGGALVCHDDEIANLIKKLRLHGISKDASSRYTKKFQQYDIDVLGWKYNISDIQSALLINQMDLIEQRLIDRDKIAQQYESQMDKLGIDYIKAPADSKSARHLFVILVEENKRDRIIKMLQDKGIGVSIHFHPIHLFTYYSNKYPNLKEGSFPVAESIGKRCISLPLYSKLTEEEQSYVVETLDKILKTIS